MSDIALFSDIFGNVTNAMAMKRQNDLAERAQIFNEDMAKQQFEYAKYFNKLQMEREDNYFQRQVRDLMSAGLSPLSVNGSPNGQMLSASVGAVPSADIKQGNFTSLSDSVAKLKNVRIQSELSESQIDYNQSVAEKNIAEKNKINAENFLNVAKNDYFNSLSVEKQDEVLQAIFDEQSIANQNLESSTELNKSTSLKNQAEREKIKAETDRLKATFDDFVKTSKSEMLQSVEQLRAMKYALERDRLHDSAKYEVIIENLKNLEIDYRNKVADLKSKNIDIDYKSSVWGKLNRAIQDFNKSKKPLDDRMNAIIGELSDIINLLPSNSNPIGFGR